jgi:hypothetical protein
MLKDGPKDVAMTKKGSISFSKDGLAAIILCLS